MWRGSQVQKMESRGAYGTREGSALSARSRASGARMQQWLESAATAGEVARSLQEGRSVKVPHACESPSRSSSGGIRYSGVEEALPAELEAAERRIETAERRAKHNEILAEAADKRAEQAELLALKLRIQLRLALIERERDQVLAALRERGAQGDFHDERRRSLLRRLFTRLGSSRRAQQEGDSVAALEDSQPLPAASRAYTSAEL
jgi:hypothetical protein